MPCSQPTTASPPSPPPGGAAAGANGNNTDQIAAIYSHQARSYPSGYRGKGEAGKRAAATLPAGCAHALRKCKKAQHRAAASAITQNQNQRARARAGANHAEAPCHVGGSISLCRPGIWDDPDVQDVQTALTRAGPWVPGARRTSTGRGVAALDPGIPVERRPTRDSWGGERVIWDACPAFLPS